jgi:phosphohistidine phosphatase SixA
MRHGSASNETSLYKDIDRPLSNSGIQEAIKAAKSIASKNPKPGRILCSNAARTKKNS